MLAHQNFEKVREPLTRAVSATDRASEPSGAPCQSYQSSHVPTFLQAWQEIIQRDSAAGSVLAALGALGGFILLALKVGQKAHDKITGLLYPICFTVEYANFLDWFLRHQGKTLRDFKQMMPLALPKDAGLVPYIMYMISDPIGLQFSAFYKGHERAY